MCCLGVACDILDTSLWRQEEEDADGFIPIVWGGHTTSGSFCYPMVEAFGAIGWDEELVAEVAARKINMNKEDIVGCWWSVSKCLERVNDQDTSGTYAAVIEVIEAGIGVSAQTVVD